MLSKFLYSNHQGGADPDPNVTNCRIRIRPYRENPDPTL